MTRGQIEGEVDELFGGGGRATQVYRGLAKVLEDRAEFEVVSDVPPEELRKKFSPRPPNIGKPCAPPRAARPTARFSAAI